MGRGSGVLLPVSSLPGPFGVGVFGKEAIEFARLLNIGGVKYWQVLPFAIPGKGNSPYMSLSAFAGNSLFIDPAQLRDDGLITDEELKDVKVGSDVREVDYDLCKAKRSVMLRAAYRRVSEDMKREIEKYLSDHVWLDDFALFLVIKEHNAEKEWWEWEDIPLRTHEKASLAAYRSRYYDEFFYHCFVQYIFMSQWDSLKQKINHLGISVIGDIPIYVSMDSADAWAHRGLFQVDESLFFPRVAGVPPDYFSTEGQLWGHPLYNWPAHEKQGYSWWLNRLGMKFQIYDLVRIDHFRAFCSYWSVPSDQETAVFGVWEKGPGMQLINVLRREYPNPPIIAEDLGEETEDLHEFLEEAGFPGMRVMQFGFDTGTNNKHLPHNYPENCIAYSGTHDNDTLVGWIGRLSPGQKSDFLEYLGLTEKDDCEETAGVSAVKAAIRVLWQSGAMLAVVPVQDLLGMGSDARINIPGTSDGNWTMRITEQDMQAIDLDWMYRINRLYGRL